MKHRSIAKWATVVATALGGPVQLTLAQGTSAQPEGVVLDEITVTAQRRSEDLQRVPIAVASMSPDDLASSNISTIQGLTAVVPGFVGPGENGMAPPHVRGIGASGTGLGIEAAFATYVDGIYIGALSPALGGLTYVQQVDVLKGPQGTLFGRNTTGGLIQINTRDPGDELRAESEIGYGSYQKIDGQFYLNVPVSDRVSTNFAVSAGSQGEGYGKNLVTGEDAYRTDLRVMARNKWDVRFTDETELKLGLDYEKVDETNTFAYRPVYGVTTNIFHPNTFPLPVPPAGQTYTSLVDGWDTNSLKDNENHVIAYGLSGRLSHDLGFATLSNQLAYRYTDMKMLQYDATKTPLDFFVVDRLNVSKQWTDELQLASNGNDRFTWTTGIFLYRNANEGSQALDYGALAPSPPGLGKLQSQLVTSKLVDESVSAYAQTDFKLTDTTTLTTGLRYSYDQHEISGRQVTTGANLAAVTVTPNASVPETSFSKGSFSWRVALAKQLTPDAMVYGSWNRGTKTGGYNPIVLTNPPFDEEVLDAYELGTKLSFLDNRARLNVAGFYNDYTNMQVQRFPVSGPPIYYNGAGARSYGVDVDLEIRPVASLTIRATLELLDSEFTDFPNATLLQPGPFGGFEDARINLATGAPANPMPTANGTSLPYAADVSASLVPTYSVPLGTGTLDMSATWTHNSGFYAAPGKEISQPAYDAFGANLTFTGQDGRYWVSLWGSNLTNEQIATTMTVTVNGSTVGLAPPRTYGLKLGFNFL